MRVADYHFDLPPELIAQSPAPERDGSRLLVLTRPDRKVEHRQFREVPRYLGPGDVLVLNDSRVLRARLRGAKACSGGRLELLLLEEEAATHDWWALLRPAKRVQAGTRIRLLGPGGAAIAAEAVVVEKTAGGRCRLRFEGTNDVVALLDRVGEVPLPPYIVRDSVPAPVDDAARYQTIYAAAPGSVAAPTAGLHFTEPLLGEIRRRGVQVVYVTLHVGLGTFAPIKSERVEDHVMHEERFELGPEAARAVAAAKAEGRRVIAVGTTTTRVLEHVAAEHGGRIVPGSGRTRLFIRPPATFGVVDGLITNFHLPGSTLLMLVSAFAAPGVNGGRELLLGTYAEAVRRGYRFYSYGDAMLIL